jgi:hypothetical protein
MRPRLPCSCGFSITNNAVVAITSYQALLIALIFLRPDLAPSWHTISEWAIGPYGWIMSCAFLISAMSYIASRAALIEIVAEVLGTAALLIGILLACISF